MPNLVDPATLRLHPIADVFPEMAEDEYTALVTNIRQHGIRRPLLVHQGAVVDGRHRWRAACELGIQCPIEEWDGTGDLEELAVSLNL